MDFPITNPHIADVPEEEKGHWALKPLFEVVRDFLFSMFVGRPDANMRQAINVRRERESISAR